MPVWTFCDYLDERGSNPIRAWLDSLPIEAEAKVAARIRYLRGTMNWPPPYISAMKGQAGLMELRIVSSGVQYRPLGFHGPGRFQFTLVHGVVEKGGKLPRSALDVAANRIKIVRMDPRRSCEHDIRARSSGHDAS